MAMPCHGPTLIPRKDVEPRHGVAYQNHMKEFGITLGDVMNIKRKK